MTAGAILIVTKHGGRGHEMALDAADCNVRPVTHVFDQYQRK